MSDDKIGVRAMGNGIKRPVMGDVVLVTKIAERGVEHRYEKDAGGYDCGRYDCGRTFRVLRVYSVEPILAVVVGVRNVRTGEIVDDHGVRELITYCEHRVYLVRTGPMNREVLVPSDGFEFAGEVQAEAFRNKLAKGRLLGRTPNCRFPGVNLSCDDGAELMKIHARG